MHIVYIHQFFCTPEGSSGTRSYDVARHLAAMGHQVTLICGLSEGSGLGDSPRGRPLVERRAMAGFDVRICRAWYSNKQGKLARLGAFLKFAALACWVVLFQVRRADLVFATSLPLTVSIPGYLGARRHRAPFVFEVRDICPEGDVICGYLRKGSLVERGLAALEWFAYTKARRLLMVSPGFTKRLLERGWPAWKLRTALLGADGDMFRTLAPDAAFRARHGLEGQTLAIYTGAHGIANGLHYLLDAAATLRDRSDITFVFLGDGNDKPALVAKAQELGLPNVRFLDPVPKTALPGILAACDIGLMILRNVGERPVTPNKIFDYMFAGLPSIVNFPGPTAEMVAADGTGVFADPTKPEDLAGQVAHWADHPDEARRIGTAARALAYSKYDRRSIARQLAEIFQEVVAGAGRAVAAESKG